MRSRSRRWLKLLISISSWRIESTSNRVYRAGFKNTSQMFHTHCERITGEEICLQISANCFRRLFHRLSKLISKQTELKKSMSNWNDHLLDGVDGDDRHSYRGGVVLTFMKKFWHISNTFQKGSPTSVLSQGGKGSKQQKINIFDCWKKV